MNILFLSNGCVETAAIQALFDRGDEAIVIDDFDESTIPLPDMDVAVCLGVMPETVDKLDCPIVTMAIPPLYGGDVHGVVRDICEYVLDDPEYTPRSNKIVRLVPMKDVVSNLIRLIDGEPQTDLPESPIYLSKLTALVHRFRAASDLPGPVQTTSNFEQAILDTFNITRAARGEGGDIDLQEAIAKVATPEEVSEEIHEDFDDDFDEDFEDEAEYDESYGGFYE